MSRLGHPVPERLLGAGAGQAQAGRQPLRGVGEALVEPGRFGAERGEERALQPPLDEGGHPLASRSAGQRLVGRPPSRRAPRSRSMPAVAPTRTSACDEIGVSEGEMQAEAAAEGVADVGRPSAGARYLRRRRPTGRQPRPRSRPWPGTSTSGEGVRRAQPVEHRQPRPAGLGEAVDQCHRASLANPLGVEHAVTLA